MADADTKPDGKITTTEQERMQAARRENRREWLVVAIVAVIAFAVLAYLTFNTGRLPRWGVLGAIGWRSLQLAALYMLIFALFALGLNMQFGFTGLINFGHVASLAIGAYTAAVLSWGQGTLFGIPVGWSGATLRDAGLLASLGYGFVIILVAVLVAVLFSLLLGIPTLKLREDYLAIVTIGAAEILRIVVNNADNLTRGPTGLSVQLPGGGWILDRQRGWAAPFGDLEAQTGINFDPYYAFIMLLTLIALIGFYLFFERLARAPWGRVVKAIREDEDVAASLGKNVFLYKMQALILGAVVAAVAGVLYGWFLRYVTPPNFLPIVTFYAWIIVVIGGLGNNKGPIVGAIILWGIFEAARNMPELTWLGIQDVAGPPQIAFIGLLIMIIMMFRPQGIMGKREEMLFGK